MPWSIYFNAFASFERALPVKLVESRGQVYIFKDSQSPLFVARPIMLIHQGHFIATGAHSTALLDLTTNGMVVLGPNTIIHIGKRSRSGLRHLDLISGRLYFQTRPEMQQRPPGAIFTIRNSPKGFYGRKFNMIFTEEERSIEVLEGQVQRLPLTIKEGVQTSGDDEWDEWDDFDEWDGDDGFGDPLEFGEEIPPDQLQDLYLSRIRQQVEGVQQQEPFSVRVERRPITGRFIARGIYNIEEATGEIDQNLTIIQNGDEIDNVQRSEVIELNPEPLAYDFRFEVNTDREVGEAQLYMRGWLEYGRPTSNYRAPLQIFNTRKEGRGPIELNEFYLTNNWTTTDLSIGKKVFKTGTGLLISQIDRITPKDLYDPLDPKDLGNWMIQLDHYFGQSSFTYLVMPYFLTNKSGVNFLAAVEDTLFVPEQVYPKGDLKSFTHYFQYKTIVSGWDLILGLKYGPNTYPIYTQIRDVESERVDTFKEHTNIFNAMFAYSTTAGPFNFYGEYLYQKAAGDKDDSFHTYHLGLKYRNTELASVFKLDFIDFFLEHSREVIIQRQLTDEAARPQDLIDDPDQFASGKFNIRSSVNWRSHRNNYLGRLVFQVNDNFNLNLNADFNLLDGSILQVIGTEYRIRDGLNLRLNYESYRVDVSRTTNESRLLPFDFEVDDTGTQSSRRTFDRYTLRLEYIF